ncbi:MAG: 30S ribosomal protein S13, partial [Candidatus Omnitrophica bacterium]|nr:30S ribosomal protein S13 [Candidatus Omnitrophota bacterium]
MPRIIGIDIPKEKKILISLTYLYGVGRKVSADILKEAGINP